MSVPASALSSAEALSRIRRRGLSLALGIVAFDQATKAWMIELVFDPPRLIQLAPFANLAPVWNRGISFGMLSGLPGSGPIILSLLALAIAGALSAWLWRTHRLSLGLALGLVIGGAIGNVIDRLHYGAVVDFLDFHVLGYHWPAFNVADSAITIGVFLMLLDTLRHDRDGPA